MKARKYMRRQSSKKRKELRETNPMRSFYVASKGVGLQCHEIPAGMGSREKAVYDPDTWLALDPAEHERIQGEELEKQAARKFIVVKAALDRCCRRRLKWDSIFEWLNKLLEE